MSFVLTTLMTPPSPSECVLWPAVLMAAVKPNSLVPPKRGGGDEDRPG
jgi:hypothetical protein